MAQGARGNRVGVAFGKFAGLGLAVAWLAGCGGGGVSIGDGQGPDPVVLAVPVAYVQHPLPANGQGQLVAADGRRLLTFNIGADLYLIERASPSATARNITGATARGPR